MLYDQPEGGIARAFPLNPDVDGTWVGAVTGDIKGQYYTYKFQVGGAWWEAADPYAVAAGVNGDRSLIVNVAETNPPGWLEHQRPPFSGSLTDAILYEMHVRDFSIHPESGMKHKGKFLAFSEVGTTGPSGVKTGLDHLRELGITHIHLLPVFDYATVDEHAQGGYNWGYDPKNYNVPEGSYATDPNGTARITEFKQLVKALHGAGIRVVMDVVYNHTYAFAHPFEAVHPRYYYRYEENGSPSNGSGTGNETASERPMVRRYILDSLRFWAAEYKVDGFRFDLMALHDAETMKQARQVLDEVDPTIIMYGEPWTGGHSVLPDWARMTKGAQRGLRIGVFNDHIRNAIKGDNDGGQKGYATGAGLQESAIRRGVAGAIDFGEELVDFALHPGESVNYVSSHDNLCLWDKITKSNWQESEEARIRMDLLCQAIVFTSQGSAFIQGGTELLRSKNGNHNSYNAGDEVNRIDWGRKAQYPQVFRYYQGLIRLRRDHPAFRLPSAELVRKHLTFARYPPPGVVAFWLKEHAGGDPWKHIVVVFNPNHTESEMDLPAPGLWHLAAHGLDIGETGRTADRRVQVPAQSMAVLYQTDEDAKPWAEQPATEV